MWMNLLAEAITDVNWDRVTSVGILGMVVMLMVTGKIVPSPYYNDVKRQLDKLTGQLDEERMVTRSLSETMRDISRYLGLPRKGRDDDDRERHHEPSDPE